MANKLMKKAPHFDEQMNNAFEDVIVLAGSKAWQAWGKGQGVEWLLLCDVIQSKRNQKPIVLGESQLKEINGLRIVRAEQRFIKIAVFGVLAEMEKTAICYNLAQNSQAQSIVFINEIGELVDDVSQYIQRLRHEPDSVAQHVAESIATPKINLDFNENQKPTQPEIAEAFLAWHSAPIRQDFKIGKSFEYNGVYWQLLSEQMLQRKIMAFYDEQGYNRYTVSHLKAIAELVAIKAEEIPTESPDYIGFKNGVLNKKTGQFLAHNIAHYLRGIENIHCNHDSRETPYFDDWLAFICNGNENKRNAILAGLYMVLTNRHEWGLFLEATGVAGAGKSVFSQIASIINGNANTAYISLQELEIDRKRAMLIGKSLAISPDQKPYKGSADELKAITGGDNVSVKLVYVDDFATKLDPVFILVTNHPLLFTDRNGGIARRRIIIPFDRAIPKEKKDVNFIDKVKGEVFGIVNKLLAQFPTPENARLILEAYKDLDEGKGIKRESNHLIDFVSHFRLADEHESRRGALRVGSARSGLLGSQNESLYSAYLFYCQCIGLPPLNVFSFKQAIHDAFKEAGEKHPYSEKVYSGYWTTNAHWKDRTHSIRTWEG